MEAVIKACRANTVPGIFSAAVIASSSAAEGLSKAALLGVPTAVVARADFKSAEEFGEALLQALQAFGIDLISNNGWLPLTPKAVVERYKNRIINQHPGPLDPGRGNDFGGTGMYGVRVMAARIIFEWITNPSDPWTEATVHFVTEKFDEGDLIHTARFSLPKPGEALTISALEKDHAIQESLRQRVVGVMKEFITLEHQTVITALSLFGEGTPPKGFRRSSPLINEGDKTTLGASKRLAALLFPKG